METNVNILTSRARETWSRVAWWRRPCRPRQRTAGRTSWCRSCPDPVEGSCRILPLHLGDHKFLPVGSVQGFTNRCRLSLLTNSAPSYTSPNAGGWGEVAVSQPMSTAVHITWHGAQINFGDLPPYFKPMVRSLYCIIFLYPNPDLLNSVTAPDPYPVPTPCAYGS